MRQINLLSAAFAAAVVAPAFAQVPVQKSDDMTPFFGATLEITVPGQDWSAKRWLKADHSYREAGDDGQVTGTWEVRDGKLCTRKDKPLEDQPPVYCNLGPGHKVGDVWSDADPVTGNKVMFALKPGR